VEGQEKKGGKDLLEGNKNKLIQDEKKKDFQKRKRAMKNSPQGREKFLLPEKGKKGKLRIVSVSQHALLSNRIWCGGVVKHSSRQNG